MARAGLTAERVVAEAVLVVDEVGFASLTLALVATRLGVRVPSLYKHVDSLGSLRASVSRMSTPQLGDSLRTAVMGRSGEQTLGALGPAYRSFAQRHPGRYAATVPAASPDDDEHTAHADAVLQVVTAALSGYRLAPDKLVHAVHAVRALRAALHGFVALETGGGFDLPVDIDRSFAALLDGLDRMLTGWPGRPGGRRPGQSAP